ncbi:MAG: glycosyltransferase family 1 protein [Gammaproteobacteria bacterium]
MRIGISTTTIDPCFAKEGEDGIGMYTRNLIIELQKLGVNISGYSSLSLKEWLKSNKNYHSLNSVLMPQRITSSLSAIFGLQHLQHRQITQNINLYHVTDYQLLKLRKIPTVVTLHDAIFLKNKDFSSLKFKEYTTWVLKKLVRYADSIITVSQAMVVDLIEYWKVPSERITVIHNGIGNEWFQSVTEHEKQQLLSKYQLQTGYLLFIGTLQPRKNLIRVMEAFCRLPQSFQKDHPLVIAGRVGWDCDAIIEKIKELTASKVAHWLKYVPASEIRTLYQCAGMVVYPSLCEGFGMPVLEAFASRVPLLGSNIAAITEVAGDAALLVNPLDTEAISHGMLQLTQNTELTTRLIEQGYQRAQTMTWTRCAEATLEIYRNL